jgi:hypothetical protein
MTMLAASATIAEAQATLINSRSGISGYTLNWMTMYGYIPTTVTGGAKATPMEGVTVTINAANPAHIQNQEPTSGVNSWFGNFGPDDPVLYSETGPIEFVFSEDIFAFGANIQPSNFGAFLGSITAYDALDNEIGSFTKNGMSNNFNDGSAIFLGIGSEFGFRRIVMNTNGYGIAVNQATFGDMVFEEAAPQNLIITEEVPVTVNPEPGTIALFAAGMMALGVGYRRRKITG